MKIEQKFSSVLSKPIFLIKRSFATSLEQLLYAKRQFLRKEIEYLEKNENRQLIIKVIDKTLKLLSGFETSLDSNTTYSSEFDFKLLNLTDDHARYSSEYYDISFKVPRSCYNAIVQLPLSLSRFLDVVQTLNPSQLNMTLLAEVSDRGIDKVNTLWNCLENLLAISGPFHHGRRQFQSSINEISKRLSAAVVVNEGLSRNVQDLRIF